ncbi:MAG: hypothetical protein J6V07_07320 [Clostridia bacterium]|nr:hypothetical protein [Clostridia bacterium]
MVKLIVGKKGSGKTKTLIEQVNAACEASKGCVICIEKGLTLDKDITHKVRLVETDSYKVNDAATLYGFIAGIAASNYDITHIYLDSTLRICGDVAAMEAFLLKVEALTKEINFTATISLSLEELPESLRKFI